MGLDSALQHLMNAKRISAPSQSYRKDNPAEYDKVKAYLDGGARPTGVVTEMGIGLVEVEDVRRNVTPPAPPPPSGPGGYGVNTGMWFDASHNPSRVASLGAKVSRVEFDISDAASSLDNVLGQLRNVGIRSQPLAGFAGRTPTVTEAQNMGAWAQRHGPNGTDSIRRIEFGNETSYGYQYGDGYPDVSYQTRARNYALRAKDAALAMAPYGVGLLVQAEDGGSGSSVWVDQMFTAVPDLPNYVAGWVIHPYGSATYDTGGGGRINRMKTHLAAHGETTKPWYLTEWGIPSDGGRTLSTGNNYGWGYSVTYQQAADGLAWAEGQWISQLGSRWAQTIIFSDADGKATGTSNYTEDYFGCIKFDNSDKGAYSTLIRAKFASSPLT